MFCVAKSVIYYTQTTLCSIYYTQICLCSKKGYFLHTKENNMWTTPSATEMRFGFEVTMYVMNK